MLDRIEEKSQYQLACGVVNKENLLRELEYFFRSTLKQDTYNVG